MIVFVPFTSDTVNVTLSPGCSALNSRPSCALLVPISDMTQGGIDKDELPPWAFFDIQEQRALYEEWLDKHRTPRVVPLPKLK